MGEIEVDNQAVIRTASRDGGYRGKSLSEEGEDGSVLTTVHAAPCWNFEFKKRER